MYTVIQLQCTDQTLQPVNLPKLASGGVEDIQVEITFDSTWKGFGRVAMFFRDNGKVIPKVLADDTCTIPWEVMAAPGRVWVGVTGISGATVRTSELLCLTVHKGSVAVADDSDPTPAIYAQVMTAIGAVSQSVVNEMAERQTAYNVLAARVNALTALGEGSTSGDAELIDARVDANGMTHANAGTAIRAQYSEISSTLNAALPVGVRNLFDPATAQNGKALTDSTGEIANKNGFWISGVMPVSAAPGVITNTSAYKMLWYDTSMAVLKTTSYPKNGQTYTKPTDAAYVIAQYEEAEVPFSERYSIAVCNSADNLTEVPTLGQWFKQYVNNERELLNLFQTDERNLLNPLKCLHGMCFASELGIRYPDANFWTTDYVAVSGETNQLWCNASMYKIGCYDADKNYISAVTSQFIFDTGEHKYAILPDGTAYVLAQFKEATVPYASRFGLILCGGEHKIEAVKPRYYAEAPTVEEVAAFGEKLFDIQLTGTTYMSDHTFINGQLYAINASSDDHAEYAGVTVYDVDPVAKTSAYVRMFNHNLGHANSIDYCEGNGCLILGNGSSDATLPGEIYILPDAANKATWEYADCIKIDVSAEDWGIKTNVVWGDHNNGEYNIAYVITNNNANVRKILLTKTDGAFDGGYILLGEWSTDVVDVNQGTVYYNGKLYIAIGHAQVWALEYTLMPDGTIRRRQLKDVFYDASGAVLTTPFAEGMTVKDGLMYYGANDRLVRVYTLT